jgi:hypothetical protein
MLVHIYYTHTCMHQLFEEAVDIHTATWLRAQRHRMVI